MLCGLPGLVFAAGVRLRQKFLAGATPKCMTREVEHHCFRSQLLIALQHHCCEPNSFQSIHAMSVIEPRLIIGCWTINSTSAPFLLSIAPTNSVRPQTSPE